MRGLSLGLFELALFILPYYIPAIQTYNLAVILVAVVFSFFMYAQFCQLIDWLKGLSKPTR